MTALAERLRHAGQQCAEALADPGNPPPWWPYLVRQLAERLPEAAQREKNLAAAQESYRHPADAVHLATMLTLAEIILADSQPPRLMHRPRDGGPS